MTIVTRPWTSIGGRSPRWRRADLAHQDETERRLERGRDFRGHRDAAARQRQYDRILALKPLLVEFDHAVIRAPDDQQRRRLDTIENGKRRPAPGYDGPDPRAEL